MSASVLVSGASIAGPAVAYWLARRGFDVTVVERAPELRPGGQAVDFRGEQQLSLLARMGVLDAIEAKQTHGGALTFVDANDRAVAKLSAAFAGGDVEILRGDLSRILYEATLPGVRYRFGDSISAIEDRRVRFVSGHAEDFDVVIGADGLHSNVRQLVFGDESRLVEHLGYYVCIFSAPDMPGERGQARCFNEPGRCAAFGDGRATLFFASPRIDYDRYDVAEQKRIVANAFANARWHVPALLDRMRRSTDFYFDSISRVRTRDLWRGRVVLLGDAAYGATIGGMGTSLAILGSYVLAGELAQAPTPQEAFASYARQIGRFARECQQGASGVGPFMAPKTRLGIKLRNLFLRASYVVPGGLMEAMVMRRARGIVLKEYVS